MHLHLLYSDDYLVAVDKPCGISTHAAQSDLYPSDLLSLLGEQIGSSYFGVHQRLDRDTSGVLLLVRRAEANAAVAVAFEQERVRKCYLAIVRGVPDVREGLIERAIAPEGNGRMKATSGFDRMSRSARTHYQVLDSAADRSLSLVELRPETGRTHQLRVHMRSLGHPIVGDAIYDPEHPAPRLMLHAWKLELPHPASGGPLALEASPPPIFGSLALAAPALALSDSLNAGGSFTDDVGEIAGMEALLQLAGERRAPLSLSRDTDIYRLLDGAADGLQGAVADRFGDRIHLCVGPEPDGRFRSRIAAALEEQFDLEVDLCGAEETTELVACENDLRYLVRTGIDHNPGVYPELRDTRGRVRRLSRSRRVLNLFAGTCGFGVAAVAGGAADVLNVEISRRMLEIGRENFRLNGFDPDGAFLAEDSFDLLERFARRGTTFDLVILDPPAWSVREGRRFEAARHFGELVTLAQRVVSRDGFLVACSPLARLERRELRRMVGSAIEEAGINSDIVGVYDPSRIDKPGGGTRTVLARGGALRGEPTRETSDVTEQ